MIKAVRSVTTLGLKEAKEAVEAAAGGQSVILEAVSKELAADAKAKIEEAGAVVLVK